MITRKQIEKTTAEWTTENPVLAADVIGIEITTSGYLRFKRGDGATSWTTLPYLDRIPVSPQIWAEARSMIVDLASSVAALVDGSSDVTPGVTGTLPVKNGGTGRATLTSGYFLKGNGTAAVTMQSASAALDAMGGQKEMSFATASTVTASTAGGKDIPLQTYVESDGLNVFSNARYSSSYGYGIKCAKAGKYLISAQADLQAQAAGVSPTVAVRKVVSGTSTYIMKASATIATSGHGAVIVISPFVAELEANSYLSLYQSLSTVITKAEGCWLTAVYLGS